jgi:hypothetical protein
MARIDDFVFDITTRIGTDACDKSQQSLQNTGNINYMMATYRPMCPTNDIVSFATQQPNINFSGSNRIGVSGCNIDTDSDLMIRDLSNTKCRINLLERPYLTVPFLGKGKGNPTLESQLQQGDVSSNRKTVTNLSETSDIEYKNIPLIDSIKNDITNPSNLIENSADDTWIRGGMPSREVNRDIKYY